MKNEKSQNPDDYPLTFQTLKKLCVDDETIEIIRNQVSDWQNLYSVNKIERATIQFMPAPFLEPDIERRSAQMAYFEKECESENPEEAIRKLDCCATELRRMVDYRSLENQILKMRCNAGEHELKAVIERRNQESRIMYGTALDFSRKAQALRGIGTYGPA